MNSWGNEFRSRNLRNCGSALTLSFFLLTTATPVVALGRTWYIKADGTGDAPTIQAGVDAASPGDVVLVAAGSYPTTSTVDIGGTPTAVCVFVSKNITLTSESGPMLTTIGSASARIAIYIVDTVANEVSGFRLETSFSGYLCVDASSRELLQVPLPILFPRGIRCEDSSPIISNNILPLNDVGIELISSPATVANNVISSCLMGVAAFSSSAEIRGNVISNCGELIVCEASAPNIHDNDLHDGCGGIRSGLGSAPNINGNTIHDIRGYGVNCGGTSITLQGNRFENTHIALRIAGIVGVSLVQGNTFVAQQFGAIDLSDNPNASISIDGNTIAATGFGAAIFCQAQSSPVIRRNIIVESQIGISCALSSFPTFECNDVVATQGRYVGECSDQTGLNGNISVDPQFCGLPATGNYSLQADSPCAPGNHPDGYDCGLIGAVGVNCGPVAAKLMTWGAIKAMYKR